MASLITFDSQGLLLHKIVLVVLVVPFQRVFLKTMGIENMALGLFLFSFALFALLQVKPVQVGFKKYISQLFCKKFFQNYLFSFLCLENYALSPKGGWSIGFLSSLFVFSFLAQFVFEDSIQLSFYAFIYTIFIIYISLRNSKLFDSIPTSWEKTLRMIESNLEMENKIPNRINKDYDFLYITSGRFNMYEACLYLGRTVRFVARMGPKPPRTPEAMEGLLQLGLGVGGIITPIAASLVANKDIQETKRAIARFQHESEVAMARFKHAVEYKTIIRQQDIELYKELEKSSQYQLDKYDQMLKEARGQEKLDLIAKREDLLKFRTRMLEEMEKRFEEDLVEPPKGLPLPLEPPKGLPLPLDQKFSPKINSPEEWDLYKGIKFSLGALL